MTYTAAIHLPDVDTEHMAQPLDGIRILDLSRILAGPWATQILADLGAEVIKIERPGKGDDTRTWGPPFLGDPESKEKESAYFLGANRGKRSLEVDIKHPRGIEVLHGLAEKSDVVVENFKVGDLKRSKLDYDTLRGINPGIIYCSITGFGQSGPYSERAGYDLMIQGMAGLMSVTGEPDSAPGGGPMKVGVALVDVLTGLYATIGILAALREREQTREGKYVDLALFDVCLASLANQSMNHLVSGQNPTRLGNRHPNISPYQTFAAGDGYVIVAVGNDLQFKRLCALLKLDALAEDPRFATNPDRVSNRAALDNYLTPVFRTQTRRHWLEGMQAAGIPGGPINNLGEAFSTAHAQSRHIARQVSHDRLGAVPTVANPLWFNGESMTSSRGAPTLGQDNHDILATILGLNEAQIQSLTKAGVVGAE